MGKPDEDAYLAAREEMMAKFKELKDLIDSKEEDVETIAAIEEAIEKLTDAKKAADPLRGPAGPKYKSGKNPPIDTEDFDVKEMIILPGDDGAPPKAEAYAEGLKAKRKAAKDKAKKDLKEQLEKAKPLTGDVDALKAAVKAAQENDVPPKELDEPQRALQEMITFHFVINAAATELKESSKPKALKVDVASLEETINEHKDGALSKLKKEECVLYMELMTKATPTNVCTTEMEVMLGEAGTLGVDEAVIKAFKKKNEEAKKAQNAKKIADRKAKKPPTDDPVAPAKPEAHPKVEVLRKKIEDSMKLAEAKLLEAKTSITLTECKKPELLTAEALNDLEERPDREEAHPNVAALTAALAAATEAKAENTLLAGAKSALMVATDLRLEVRTNLARSNMLTAAATPPIDCEVGKLGNFIDIAKKEAVDEAVVDKAQKHLDASYKAQSEGGLEPLSRPQEISHEGFQIIDPLKKALDEARKRGGEEDLLIKSQAKLDFWIEARERRDKSLKELKEALKPAPVTVDQTKVHACLTESTDAKLDPELIKQHVDKLKVAELAQRVYSKSKAPPGTLAIDVLERELEEVGGSALADEQKKQAEMEAAVEAIQDQIDMIDGEYGTKYWMKDLKTNAKFDKKKPTKQKDTKSYEEIQPAWVRDEDVEPTSPERATVESTDVQQAAYVTDLKDKLKAAQAQLKAQEDVVKSLTSTVVVPQDVVIYAQLKMKAAKCCDEMQKAQVAPLLDLNLDRLRVAIKACEFKFGNLEINGLDELDCNVPKEELEKARSRLRDADRAQKRQARARSQLQVRVNAPTGTATFDMLVKLVAEAREAEVEEDLIARAELKLKKMEELAASSLRAGPLAFVSFHLPCLRSCVSRYAISLVEQAEVKRRQDAERQLVAGDALRAQIGTWQKGQINKTLLTTDITQLKLTIVDAAHEGCSQELIDIGRQKLVAIDKYKLDKSRGLIKDDTDKKKKDDDGGGGGGGGKKKPKFKNYGYVKKEPEG